MDAVCTGCLREYNEASVGDLCVFGEAVADHLRTAHKMIDLKYQEGAIGSAAQKAVDQVNDM